MFSNDSCNVISSTPRTFYHLLYRVSYCFFDTIYNAESLKLKPEDIVAMEANSLAFVMEREMRVIGCTVVILHASQLSIIYASTKKTDKEDAVKLARLIKLYEKEDLPIVDVPTDTEWNRRKLVRETKSLKEDRTREINRLHALFVQCGITTITKSDLKRDTKRQHVLPQLFGYEADQAKRVCERLTVLEGHIQTLEGMIKKEREERRTEGKRFFR